MEVGDASAPPEPSDEGDVMAPTTMERRNTTWLTDHLRSWVDAGIITTQQAEDIERHEHVVGETPRQRLTLPAEVAAYIGSVLALMGGGAVVGSSWDDLHLAGQLAVGFAVMALGFAAGTWLVRVGEPGTLRLGWFLWAVGTGGVAITAFAAGRELWPDDDAMVAIVVGAAVLAVSIGLWRNGDRPLQLLSGAVGFGIALGGIAGLTDPPMWVMSVVLMATGAGLVVGAIRDVVRPHVIALGLGAVGAYVGGFMLTDVSERLGAAVALAIAIVAVVVALSDRTVPILVLGVAGALIATQGLLATTFTGALSALIVTALGVAIVIGVVVHSMRRPAGPTRDDRPSGD